MISIDLGYGYTKAVTNQKKIIFPSVIAPAQESTADFGKSLDYLLEYRNKDEITKHQLFVGDLAAKGSRVPVASLKRTKFTQQESIAMTLTAAYLLECEKQTHLVLGLPLAYYKSQYRDVKDVFQRVAAYISVNKGPERFISFSRVNIFAQGAGAVYAQSDLPEKGLVGLLDIGYYTTNCILFECTPEDLEPLKPYNLTIEIGVSTALKYYSEKMGQLTGAPISLIDAQYLWKRRHFLFRGVAIDSGSIISEAKKAVVSSLTESVMNIWSEKIDRMDDLLLSGGGSLEFNNEIKKVFPLARLVKEPQFANALGYLELAEGLDTPEKISEHSPESMRHKA